MEATYFPQPDDIIDAVTGDFFAERGINRRGIRNWSALDLSAKAL